MVWLPGAYHAAQDFVAAGFAAAVRARRAALDLVFVDLELGHVGDRSALQQLRSDVVLPARAAGVSIWLGGISLGGLFALDYAASYPDELDGLCLFAPYLGNRMLTARNRRRRRDLRAGNRANLRKPTKNVEYGATSRPATPAPGRCTWDFGTARSIFGGARAAGGHAAGRARSM